MDYFNLFYFSFTFGVTVGLTVHFYGKNLSGNNSLLDFDGIVDTMDPY